MTTNENGSKAARIGGYYHPEALQLPINHLKRDRVFEPYDVENRSDCLDYKAALAADLPIGSGEIESAHRYVLQKRLKISGAWWTLENLGKMVALRVTRVNQAWEDYWFGISQKTA